MNITSLIKIDKNEKIFIDTNILIFLFSPSFINSEQWMINKYSQIFATIVSNKNKLYINSLVVSEFINLCLRIDFNKNFNTDGRKNYKKDYRNSVEYRTTFNIVRNELKKILRLTSIIDDNLSSIDIISEFNKYQQLDFNDFVIANTVIKNDFKLLSDDNDFDNYAGLNRIVL